MVNKTNWFFYLKVVNENMRNVFLKQKYLQNIKFVMMFFQFA